LTEVAAVGPESASTFRRNWPLVQARNIFGAAKYNLKIVDLPVRYGERLHGTTNI
jgi:hypothetical protein